MPKKSSRKKTVHRAKKEVSRHFLWSVFFVAMTAAVNILLVGDAKSMSEPYTWPLVAVLVSVLTIVTVGYERKTGKFGNRKFMWSILFAALTLAITLYSAGLMQYDMWTSISAGSSALALILLVYEKYHN